MTPSTACGQAEVDVGVCRDTQIITLTGREPARGLQIGIGDAVRRFAAVFTIVNRIKREPPLRLRALRLS